MHKKCTHTREEGKEGRKERKEHAGQCVMMTNRKRWGELLYVSLFNSFCVLFPNDKGHMHVYSMRRAAVAVALLSYYYSRNPPHPTTTTTTLEKESRATTIIIL